MKINLKNYMLQNIKRCNNQPFYGDDLFLAPPPSTIGDIIFCDTNVKESIEPSDLIYKLKPFNYYTIYLSKTAIAIYKLNKDLLITEEIIDFKSQEAHKKFQKYRDEFFYKCVYNIFIKCKFKYYKKDFLENKEVVFPLTDEITLKASKEYFALIKNKKVIIDGHYLRLYNEKSYIWFVDFNNNRVEISKLLIPDIKEVELFLKLYQKYRILDKRQQELLERLNKIEKEIEIKEDKNLFRDFIIIFILFFGSVYFYTSNQSDIHSKHEFMKAFAFYSFIGSIILGTLSYLILSHIKRNIAIISGFIVFVSFIMLILANFL